MLRVPHHNNNSIVLNKATQFSLSASEYYILRHLIAHYPQQTCFLPGQVTMREPNLCNEMIWQWNHIVLKTEQGYVVIGRPIGEGNWSMVHICLLFPQINDPKVPHEYWVAKFAKPVNPITGIFMNPERIHADMAHEAKLVRGLYGKAVSMYIPELQRMAMLMPFLGEMSLADLLGQSGLVSRILPSEWLKFFMNLSLQLQAFHSDPTHAQKMIHGDIKPPNIVLTLNRLNEHFYFTQMHLLDFGNAQTTDTFRLTTAFSYQPIEAMLCLSQFRNAKIDIFALGKTFLKVLEETSSYWTTMSEQKGRKACHTLFSQMTALAQDDRPELSHVVSKMILIKSEADKELAAEIKRAKIKDNLKLLNSSALRTNLKPINTMLNQIKRQNVITKPIARSVSQPPAESVHKSLSQFISRTVSAEPDKQQFAKRYNPLSFTQFESSLESSAPCTESWDSFLSLRTSESAKTVAIQGVRIAEFQKKRPRHSMFFHEQSSRENTPEHAKTAAIHRPLQSEPSLENRTTATLSPGPPSRAMAAEPAQPAAMHKPISREALCG